MVLFVLALNSLLTARFDALAILSHAFQQTFVFDRILQRGVKALTVQTLISLLGVKLEIFT